MIIKMETSDTSLLKLDQHKIIYFCLPFNSPATYHSKESQQNRTESPEQANAIQLIVLSLTFPMASRALFGSFSFNITFIATECFKVIFYACHKNAKST